MTVTKLRTATEYILLFSCSFETVTSLSNYSSILFLFYFTSLSCDFLPETENSDVIYLQNSLGCVEITSYLQRK